MQRSVLRVGDGTGTHRQADVAVDDRAPFSPQALTVLGEVILDGGRGGRPVLKTAEALLYVDGVSYLALLAIVDDVHACSALFGDDFLNRLRHQGAQRGQLHGLPSFFRAQQLCQARRPGQTASVRRENPVATASHGQSA